MDDALRVEALVAGYGQTDILHDVSLRVGPEEVVAVLGPNGAGKSTVLKAVFGLVDVRGGRIVVGGEDVAGWRPQDLVRAGVGYVPQLRNVFPSLSVRENLDMGRVDGGDEDRVYSLFPALESRKRQRVGTLSGGERQMVAMGRALMGRPRFLMLDEPSAGLAPNLTVSVFDAVRRIARSGIPILLVEQNAGQALAISDRAYVLDQGHNRFEGRADELARDEDVMRLYLGG